ncbi:MAG: hypothetical protein ACI93R_001642 [Flavobacteriales bacterium]|jgi:hypothetical protein
MVKEQSKVDLLTVYDDFVEFNDYCSFLCDAIPALFVEYAESERDSPTMQGLKRHCGDLKEKTEKLGSVLNALYQQTYTDTQITELKPRT